MGNSVSTKSLRSSLFEAKPTVDPIANLAPLNRIASDDEESECPICFNNYEALNIIVCCKGKICTSCHVELTSLKSHDKKTKFECPFCSSSGYKVSFGSSSSSASPSKADSKKSASFSSTNVSTPNHAPSSSTRKSTQVILASVEDRQQIENEIKSQRKNSRPMSSTHSMTSSRSSRSYSIDSNQMASPASALSTPFGIGTPMSAQSSHARQSARTAMSAQEVSFDHLVHSIMRGIHSHSAAVDSIADFESAERLEQLMILQAIQMSLRDSNGAESGSGSSSAGDRNVSESDSASSSSADIATHEFSELKMSASSVPDAMMSGDDERKQAASNAAETMDFSDHESPGDQVSGSSQLVVRPSRSEEGWKVFADANEDSTHCESSLSAVCDTNPNHDTENSSPHEENSAPVPQENVGYFDDYFFRMFNS